MIGSRRQDKGIGLRKRGKLRGMGTASRGRGQVGLLKGQRGQRSKQKGRGNRQKE